MSVHNTGPTKPNTQQVPTVSVASNSFPTCGSMRPGSNRVNWSEFQSACQKLRYHGDIAGAWRAFDTDLSGYLTLKLGGMGKCGNFLGLQLGCKPGKT